MSDLISRSAVIKLIDKKIETTSDFLQHNVLIELDADVEELPPVEAVPVVHGNWLHRSIVFATCSECGEIVEREKKSNFCPNCGADMRKKVE